MESSQTNQVIPPVFDVPRQLGIYRLTRFLGRGGMGEVWRAFDTQLERDVAIKFMHRDQLADEEAVKRFYREARSVARLNHPHIMHVHAISEENGIIYLVMELVDGVTLARRVMDEGAMPLVQALQIIQQTVAGLGYAHTRGIIHRDIKPSNLMLAEGFQVKITDFGLAKAVEQDVSTTGSSVMLGTPAYISPEQIRGLAADHRSDIYALGCTLYQLLTGELPFRGPMATVLLKHIQEPLPEPESLLALRDGAVMAVIRKMTAKNPDERYQTYGGLSAALSALETGAPLPLTETPRRALVMPQEAATVAIPVVTEESAAADAGSSSGRGGQKVPESGPVTVSLTGPVVSAMPRRMGRYLVGGAVGLAAIAAVALLGRHHGTAPSGGPVAVAPVAAGRPEGASSPGSAVVVTPAPEPVISSPPPPLAIPATRPDMVPLTKVAEAERPAASDPPPPLTSVVTGGPVSLESVPEGGALTTFLAGRLPQATQMHGSAVVGDRLFILGGETLDGWSNLVHSATIGSDGKLGEWRLERELPERRAYIGSSVQVAGNHIYVVGGLMPAEPTQDESEAPGAREVLWTSVLPDGTLAPWEKSDGFLPGHGLYNIAAASTGMHLYAVGGFFDGFVSAAVYVADLQDDGMPVYWRQVANTPVPLWFHGAGVVDGRLYVWGGLTGRENTTVNGKVYSAALGEDGSLGEWKTEGEMPNPTYSAACCGLDGRLLSVTGRYQNGTATDEIWSAVLSGSRLGPWESRGSDLETRMYHSFGIDPQRGWVFVTGGRHKFGRAGEEGHFVDAVQLFRVEGR